MKRVNVDVIIMKSKNDFIDSREIKIPWVYGNNIGKPFKVGESVYKFDAEALREFLTNPTTTTITINADKASIYSNTRTKEGVSYLTVPLDWFYYYIDLGGVTLKPNMNFMNNDIWNVVMDFLFSTTHKFKAMWTIYTETPNVHPVGLSLIQEKYLPDIEYIDECDSYTITVKWGYSVKDLPMLVSMYHGLDATSGKLCFKDYKEKFVDSVSQYGDTYNCNIQLTQENNFSITVFIDTESESDTSHFKIKLLDITDDSITFSILGKISGLLQSALSNEDLVAVFIWKVSSDGTPMGFQIIPSKNRACKINYIEMGGFGNE